MIETTAEIERNRQQRELLRREGLLPALCTCGHTLTDHYDLPAGSDTGSDIVRSGGLRGCDACGKCEGWREAK